MNQNQPRSKAMSRAIFPEIAREIAVPAGLFYPHIPKLKRSLNTTQIKEGVDIIESYHYGGGKGESDEIPVGSALQSVMLWREYCTPLDFNVKRTMENSDMFVWTLTKLQDDMYLLQCSTWNHLAKEWSVDSDMVNEEGMHLAY